MSRRLGLSLLVLAALAAAPAAYAGGPAPGALQDGIGVVSGNGNDRFVAQAAGTDTVLARIRVKNGAVRASTLLPGAWGVPAVTSTGRGGLSIDGRLLVLAQTGIASPSRFLVVETGSLTPLNSITLKGHYSFDALSPDGSRLYLIQHMSLDDYSHYIVRAYDLDENRLLPGRIADKTQRGWVMEGFALTRATSQGGRWVYTLYMNPGGYPFIHALDTVHGVAHCIGLPYTGDQGKLSRIVLGLADGGGKLEVRWKSGARWLGIDTSSWRITHARPTAATGDGFPWTWVSAGAGLALVGALALGAVAVARRRQAKEALPVPL